MSEDRERIDWLNLPMFPRKRVDGFRDRLKLVDLKKRRAKGPKNHSTNKERSYADRRKHRVRMQERAAADAEQSRFKTAVRAYWLGETDTYPQRGE